MHYLRKEIKAESIVRFFKDLYNSIKYSFKKATCSKTECTER